MRRSSPQLYWSTVFRWFLSHIHGKLLPSCCLAPRSSSLPPAPTGTTTPRKVHFLPSAVKDGILDLSRARSCPSSQNRFNSLLLPSPHQILASLLLTLSGNLILPPYKTRPFQTELPPTRQRHVCAPRTHFSTSKFCSGGYLFFCSGLRMQVTTTRVSLPATSPVDYSFLSRPPQSVTLPFFLPTSWNLQMPPYLSLLFPLLRHIAAAFPNPFILKVDPHPP